MKPFLSLGKATGLAAIAALLALQASAQTAAAAAATSSGPQADAGQPVDEVVVRGRRMSEVKAELQDYALSFVRQVVALPPGGGYARWNGGVCVGVHNLELSAAQYIVDRVSRQAADLGLEAGAPGCRPNVMIIFATNPTTVAAYMVENEPKLFRPANAVCCMDLGYDALQDFEQSDAPVRWWHVSMPVDARTGQRAIRLPQDDAIPVIAVAGPSRIHGGIRDDLSRVLIIVDATQLTGTTWQQIGDYLAVISLAQINPKADPSAFDSILNLFTNPAAYSGLTDWDRTYLRALYSMDQERTHGHQRNEVVSQMVARELENGQ